MKPTEAFLKLWFSAMVVIFIPNITLGDSITSTYPTNNATDVSVDTTIIAYFDNASVPINDYYVSTGSGYDYITVPGSWEQSGTQVTFTPASSLDHSTVYTATISFNSGYALENYSWSFTTEAAQTTPVVVTGSATSISSSTAILNGTVNPQGASTSFYFEYGTSTSYGSSTPVESAGSGTSNQSVNATISGLNSNTHYYFRIVAYNSGGTAYGNEMTLTTNLITSKPTVSTGVAINKTSNSATLTGLINPNGGLTTYYFQYGPTTGYGHTTAETTLDAGNEVVSVEASITGLYPSTAYHYRLVATNENGTTLGSDNTFTTDFETNTRYQKAILVAGGGPYAANTIWDATLKCTDTAYKALLDQGFEKDEIYYLSPVDTSDPDGNGLYDDVSSGATNDDLNYAINNWALDAQDLLVYMVDHGGDGIFQMRQGETLSALELDSWLDSIQQYLTGEVIVVYDACHAGSFVSQLSPPAGKNRTVVTSTGTDSAAYFVAQGTVSFSFLFWSHIANGYSFYSSYVNAKNAMLTMASVEALIDCNGNGSANEKEDQDLALAIRLGNEAGTGATPPEIGSVSAPQSLSEGTSATVYAENVTSYEGIQKVWAVVTPPGYYNVSTLDPVTDEDLDTFDLADVGNGRYETTYTEFTEYGTYTITLFALDVNGFVSDPQTTTVTRTQGASLDEGFLVTENLWIRSVIHTVDKGDIEGVWQLGGQDTTARGDQVIWGYFYADPDIMTWGSRNNPDLFVKIWIDVNGPVYVDYFHVSVPDIEVYTDYPYNGSPDEQSRATLTNRFVEHYYLNGVSGSNIQAENGAPPAGYSATANPTGTTLVNDLKIGAMINTVDKGPIEGVWRLGGQDTTARGDQVVWGYFYADPDIMNWGSRNNPDLFVKIWFDVAGAVFVDFFHVSVPDIEVYSGQSGAGGYENSGTAILLNRFIEHAY